MRSTGEMADHAGCDWAWGEEDRKQPYDGGLAHQAAREYASRLAPTDAEHFVEVFVCAAKWARGIGAPKWEPVAVEPQGKGRMRK